MEPGVARVTIEPKTIFFPYKGEKKLKRYTPDLLVEFTPGGDRHPFYVECKYTDALTDEMRSYHDFLKGEFRARDETLIVRTEIDTYDQMFSARRFLLLARDEPVDVEIEANILRTHREGMTVGELLKLLSDDRHRQLEITPQVWRLVAYRRLFVQDAAELNEGTVLSTTANSIL